MKKQLREDLRWQLDQFDFVDYPPLEEEIGFGGKLIETDYFPRVLRLMFPHLAVGVGGQLYNWARGSWYPILRKDNLDFVSLALSAAERQGWETDTWWLKNVRMAPALQKKIIDRLIMHPNYNRLLEKPPIDKVNLLNGIYDVKTETLEKSRQDFMSPLQFQYNYNPKAECPTWERFLKESLPEDVYEAGVMWEILGWLLVPYTELQKAVLLYGPTCSGKSTFLNQIDRLFGQAQKDRRLIEHIPLQTLTKSGNYQTANLADKLINICGDLSDAVIEDTSMFKRLTGEDSINARMIYAEPIDFTPYARLLFSKNPPMPQALSAGGDWYRRWLIVPFPNTCPEERQDKKLRQKLAAELDGALVKALAGLTRVLKNESITETESMKRALLEMKEAGPDAYLDSIVREHFEVSAGGFGTVDEVARVLNTEQSQQRVDHQKVGYVVQRVFPSRTLTKRNKRPGFGGIARKQSDDDI